MVEGRIGAASVTSRSGVQAAFGGLARMARAAFSALSPPLMKASASANSARSPPAAQRIDHQVAGQQAEPLLARLHER